MKSLKCSSSGWCKHLSDQMTEPNRKGINPVVVCSRAGKFRTVGVAYKKSQADRGICLNYCPFCGVKIAPDRKGFYEERQ